MSFLKKFIYVLHEAASRESTPGHLNIHCRVSLWGLSVCKPSSFEMKNNWPFNQKNDKSKGSSMSVWNKTVACHKSKR